QASTSERPRSVAVFAVGFRSVPPLGAEGLSLTDRADATSWRASRRTVRARWADELTMLSTRLKVSSRTFRINCDTETRRLRASWRCALSSSSSTRAWISRLFRSSIGRASRPRLGAAAEREGLFLLVGMSYRILQPYRGHQRGRRLASRFQLGS